MNKIALLAVVTVAVAGLHGLSALGQGHGEESTWFATVGGLDDDQGWFGVDVSGEIVVAVGETGTFGYGSSDGFVAAMSKDGNLRWAVAIGGASSDNFRGVAIGPNGSVYVAGMGRSFGAGSYDAIVGKFDEYGNKEWLQYVGSDKLDAFWDIALDSNGSAVAVGYTMGFNASKLDVVLAKFGPDSRVEWAERIGGPLYEYGWAVAIDENGSIYVGGQTNSLGAGSYDGLLMKLTHDGRMLWAVAIGGPSSDAVQAIKPCEDGSVLFAGNTMSAGAGRYDAFVGKYVPGEGIQWLVIFGGPDNDVPYGMGVAPNGDIYVAGYTYSFATGDEGKADSFVAIISQDGTLKSFTHIGGPYTEFAYALATDEEGNAYIVGKVDSFGAGGLDMLVAKLSPNFLSSPTLLKWTNDEFPLNVNASAAEPALNQTEFNVTTATFDTEFVSLITTDPGVNGLHWLPETHLATVSGNPPYAVTVTETVTETLTTTVTETQTTTETMTTTATEIVVTTHTETTTEIVTETTTATTTQTETTTATETVTTTLTTTHTSVSTTTHTTTSTETTTEYKEVASPTALAGTAVLGLVIGVGLGYVLLKRKSS